MATVKQWKVRVMIEYKVKCSFQQDTPVRRVFEQMCKVSDLPDIRFHNVENSGNVVIFDYAIVTEKSKAKEFQQELLAQGLCAWIEEHEDVGSLIGFYPNLHETMGSSATIAPPEQAIGAVGQPGQILKYDKPNIVWVDPNEEKESK